MSLFAEVTVKLTAIAAWVVAGLVAGWLARRAAGAPGYGLAAELFASVAGAVGGGLVYSMVMPDPPNVVVGTVIAFFSACVVIAVARLATRQPSSG
jgi:uncharacterized membrane protein YeaQ/YmgE (transglycosylase-associated protein family)